MEAKCKFDKEHFVSAFDEHSGFQLEWTTIMLSNCTGICHIDHQRLEYQVVAMEFIVGQSIAVEAIGFNPATKREEVFKFATKNLNGNAEPLRIAMSIAKSVADEIGVQGVRKIVIRDKKVFWVAVK